MREKYKETFDGVHASQRLKTEVLNMKREENMTKKRRVPAAVLIVAVLVIALAGTALAGYFGKVTILPQNQSTGGTESDYEIFGNCDRIPTESLSEEVLALAAEADAFGASMIGRDFASLSECEAFLGLELAGNPILEQQDRTLYVDGTPAASSVYAFFSQRALSSIRVDSFYEVDGYRVNEYILLRTENSDNMSDYDILLTVDNEASTEEYITPHGMEASIFTGVAQPGGYAYASSFFVKGHALFMLSIADEDGRSHESGNRAMDDLLKEILDAYE